MKLVGITGFISESKLNLNTAYTGAFTRAGVTPIVIPELILKNRELITPALYNDLFRPQIDKYADTLDALVLSGGGDINPDTFDEENYASYNCDSIRDFMEIALFRAFLKRKKPVMGICRGFQLAGKLLKFDNFQEDLGSTGELHSGSDRELKGRQEACHSVLLYGSFQEYLIKAKNNPKLIQMSVNSWHHQGFTFSFDGKPPKLEVGKKFKDWYQEKTDSYEKNHHIEILACTSMVLEAFRHKKLPIFGVQWHPEEYGPDGLTIQYFIDTYLGN